MKPGGAGIAALIALALGGVAYIARHADVTPAVTAANADPDLSAGSGPSGPPGPVFVDPPATTPIPPPAPVPAVPASASASASAGGGRGSIAGLSVNATFATRGGGGTILVTRGDGTRGLVPAGTDVVPGTRLVAVAADRATFAAGATRFWMPIQSAAAARADPGPAVTAVTQTAPPPPPPPSVTAATPGELRDAQAFQAALAPGAEGVRRGYRVRTLPPLFAKAGLQPGDIITGINGRAFTGPTDIALLARDARISSTILFSIRRGGEARELQVQQP